LPIFAHFVLIYTISVADIKKFLYFCSMKRSAKIGISVLAVCAVILIVATCLNTWIKILVRRQLNDNIATAHSYVISYDDISVSVLLGQAEIKNIYFCTDSTEYDEESLHPVAQASVERISLDGINYFNWLTRRQLNLTGFTILNPTCQLRFIHELDADKGDLQEQVDEARRARLEHILKIARIFIDDAVIDKITILNASIDAESINDSLRICVPDFSMEIEDLGYNVQDLLPHYNDSIFHFLMRDVEVYIPKVPMTVNVGQFRADTNGVMQIDSVQIQSYLNPSHTEQVLAEVQQITAGGFDAGRFNTLKDMKVKNLHIYSPSVRLRINESPKDAQHPQTTTTSTQNEIAAINTKLAENLSVIQEFITGLTIDTILLHDAGIHVHSTASHFSLQASQLSLALYGLGYSLIDEIPYHYNDSVYQFYLGYVDITTPDSVLGITASNMRYDNGGAFTMGKTHIRHIIDKWQLTHLAGEEPVSLIDMHLDSLYTSSKNIVKEVYTLENGFFLDTLYANVSSLNIFRDARNNVKEPYCLPQTYLTQLSYPFVVHCVKANINHINISMALTKENIGKLSLGPIHLNISNVTPIRNSVISTSASGKIGKGNVNAVFKMTVNESCNWHMKLNARNMDAHHLDPLLYPLFGMRIGCNIHSITADYGGDVQLAQGTYCMTYDHVDLFADKNSNSPIKIVKDLSGLINSADKTIIHKANPTVQGKAPIAYHVQWKNNNMVNPAMFYIGPVVDGCIETMLPGLFVHKRVKNPKANKANKPVKKHVRKK